MARVTEQRDHPLSMRLTEEDIAVIDRAAALRGCSRADFMREAAVRAAKEALMEDTLIRMSADGFEAFPHVSASPARAVPEMVDLLRRRAPWESGQG